MDVNVWNPVSLESLPDALVESVQNADWQKARRELAHVMDGLSTDGPYGRALLQLVRSIPLGIDPVFDRYRAAAAIDFGDWDDLRRSLEAAPFEARELVALRETLLTSVNELRGRPTESPLQSPFLAYEFELTGRVGWYRQWARRLPALDARSRFQRPDVPAGRHFRFRTLHHAVLLAVGEAHAGSLFTAAALSSEGERLGDDGEPLRDLASDLNALVLLALGDRKTDRVLRLFERTPRPRGTSPLGTLEWLIHLMPFLSLTSGESFEQAAGLMQNIATRIAAPKAQLQAYAWVTAARSPVASTRARSELPGLLSAAHRADAGLRVLPQMLAARASGRYSDFEEVERLARRVGNVWAQISALCWMIALDPAPRVGFHFDRLLRITGWRRPVLVPSDVLAEAAVGLFALGFRSQHLIELALAAGQTTSAVDIASRHAKAVELPRDLRLAGVEALATIGTTHAQRALSELSVGGDEVGQLAATLAYRRPHVAGLSEREIEVLNLAGQGLTNRQIAERLTISQHTVARHLINAREKLGATNRADAAVRLGRLESGRPVSSNPVDR